MQILSHARRRKWRSIGMAWQGVKAPRGWRPPHVRLWTEGWIGGQLARKQTNFEATRHVSINRVVGVRDKDACVGHGPQHESLTVRTRERRPKRTGCQAAVNRTV